ncbi:MAG: Asp-tRNA(Asn)/Glu-tRNA(Gln) amidotransferase GatCAB subunit A [Acidobacteria bacterium]|nr:Asp-tRNA(Asn)/Glu-tRNA(Gln) amidotransferase GatCAB subunit A [Acidobacteriota bacterium]
MAVSSLQTITDIRSAIEHGATAVEVCQHFLDRITSDNASIHAFTQVAADKALQSAQEIDRRRPHDPALPLVGVPVAVKDNICTQGIETTASSRILKGFIPPYDATAIERLNRAGAIILGKTNCDEFAMGSTTEHSVSGPTKNPWDLDRVPGGSSGGSAAAVAARLAPVALGSDTGGSIRQPAAFCGIVGLKPTYGRVSRYGLLAFASSLDQIGPFALTVTDAAILLEVIAGQDPHDATSSAEVVPEFEAALTRTLSSPTIGVPWGILEDGLDSNAMRTFSAAVNTMEAAGATIVEVSLPHAKYAVPVYYLIAPAEASSNLARYDGIRYAYRASDDAADTSLGHLYNRTRHDGFGDEVKRRIMLGTYALSAGYYDAYYLKAQQVRTLIKDDYDNAFKQVDAIAMPTTPTTAFKLGELSDDPLELYLGDVFTASANLTGLPAISLPCGRDDSNLPVGLQLVGRAFDEATLLQLGLGYEQQAPWWRNSPPAATTASPSHYTGRDFANGKG